MCLDSNQFISIIHDPSGGQSSCASRFPRTLTVNAYHSSYAEYAVFPQQPHTHKQIDHCLRKLCAEKHAGLQVRQVKQIFTSKRSHCAISHLCAQKYLRIIFQGTIFYPKQHLIAFWQLYHTVNMSSTRKKI